MFLYKELKEHSFEKEKEKECAIEITWDDVDYSKEFDCTVLISSDKPLNGKYYLTDIEQIRYYKNGKLHRDDSLPTIISKGSSVFYYVNGKRHRIDGPACIYLDGKYLWYINGYHIEKEKINNWLNEHNIPLDWNTWTDNDKFLFAIHWSDYKGE